MKRILAFAMLFLACGARAEEAMAVDPTTLDDAASTDNRPESGVSITPKDKFIFGNQHYRSNDASIEVDLPRGLGLYADYNFYQSDISSLTRNFSIGADVAWKQAYFSATYSWNPLQNDSANHSIDGKASVHTPSKDFRTTFGLEGSVTDNFQYLRYPKTTQKIEISQYMGTVSLRQQLFGDTRVSADLSDYWYNQNLKDYSLGLAQAEFLLNKTHPRIFNGVSNTLNGVSGLVSGFPDWSVKAGITQDIDALPVPVTLWANYENTHYAATYVFDPPTLPKNSLVSGVTSDSATYGIDVEVVKDLTATAQYNHVRQTGQTVQDLYGASLEKRF